MLAATVWAHRIANRHVIWWLDQNAARQGLIKGYSPSLENAAIIDEAAQRLAHLGCYPWFTRVPSPSNPADFPSRLEWQRLLYFFPDVRRVRLASGCWDY